MTRRSDWLKRALCSLVLMTLLVGMASTQMASALACDGWYGRACWRGYFGNNKITSGDDVINGGMPGIPDYNKQVFINRVGGHLNSGDPHQVTAAQFIILSMSGGGGGIAKQVTGAQWADWVNRVNNPAVIMRVENALFECNISNSYYQTAYNDIAAGYSTPSGGCGVIDTMIDFYYNGGLVYRIRVACANPLGNLPGLPPGPPPIPPTVVSCGYRAVTPTDPEIGQSTSVRATVNYSGGPPPPGRTIGNATITVFGPGYNQTWNNLPAGDSGSSAIFDTPAFSIPTSGVYTVLWSARVNGVGPPAVCGGTWNINSDSFVVTTHPFIDVRGGDVAAGASFATVAGATSTLCGAAPSNTRAGVVGWNNNNNGAPNFAGAGGQYGVQAMNYIQSFISNRNRIGNGATLAFANRNPPIGAYGGQFKDAPCVDYWNPKPVQLTPLAANSVNLTGMSGKVIKNGNLTIGASTINDNTRLTLYVDGDVNITGNISYQNNGNNWTSLAQIPNFKLIVHGRIFINSNVAALDGTYAAVPDNNYTGPSATQNTYANPQRGTISTCSSGFSTHNPATIAANPAVCGSTLTVNGSLAANQVFFLRTNGSVVNGTPSEVINYSPEMWLSPSVDATVDSFYQSITGLPPVL